jgi:hypothetical protein
VLANEETTSLRSRSTSASSPRAKSRDACSISGTCSSARPERAREGGRALRAREPARPGRRRAALAADHCPSRAREPERAIELCEARVAAAPDAVRERSFLVAAYLLARDPRNRGRARRRARARPEGRVPDLRAGRAEGAGGRRRRRARGLAARPSSSTPTTSVRLYMNAFLLEREGGLEEAAGMWSRTSSGTSRAATSCRPSGRGRRPRACAPFHRFTVTTRRSEHEPANR